MDHIFLIHSPVDGCLGCFPVLLLWTVLLWTLGCTGVGLLDCVVTLVLGFFFVQFSRSVVSDSLRPHGLQHTRLPCPSATPRAYSNSCPSSQWCHPTISSSIVPFFSCLQSFLASGSFTMSQLFISGPKYWSFIFSISPSNEISGLISFMMDWLDLLADQGILKSLLQHHSSNHRSVLGFLYSSTLTSIHDHWKNHSFD